MEQWSVSTFDLLFLPFSFLFHPLCVISCPSRIQLRSSTFPVVPLVPMCQWMRKQRREEEWERSRSVLTNMVWCGLVWSVLGVECARTARMKQRARGRIRERVGSIVDLIFHVTADPNMKQRGGEVGFSRVLMCIHLPLGSFTCVMGRIGRSNRTWLQHSDAVCFFFLLMFWLLMRSESGIVSCPT